MPTLSLALIVKDEALTLPHCLGSVRGLADQVVVVDTGSRDGTPDLARTLGAEVHAWPWNDDFAAARNASLAACRGDWVLILDADEAIDARDHPGIREALRAPNAHAYRLTIRNYYASGTQSLIGQAVAPNPGGYAEGQEWPYCADFPALRLARRHPGLAFQGRIHELLDPWFETQDLPIHPLGAVIHHYGKVFQDREARKKAWYLDLARREARREPGSFQAQFNLLQQALAAASWKEALEAATACLAHQPVPLALLGAGLALQELGRPGEALPHLDALIAQQPGHSLARSRRGVSLALLGRGDEALLAWRAVRREDPGCSLAHLNQAEFEAMAGQPEAALRTLEEGLQACPRDPALWERRIQLAATLQGLGPAARLARQALERLPEGGDGLWHRLAALGEAQEGRLAEALAWVQQGLERHPENPDLIGLGERLGGGTDPVRSRE